MLSPSLTSSLSQNIEKEVSPIKINFFKKTLPLAKTIDLMDTSIRDYTK